MTVFAAENPISSVAAEVDYMNYDFPEDAVILYQGEDGVIYQSNEQTADDEGIVPYSTEYANVWINAGEYKASYFTIKNPHTIINTTQGTFKIESDYANATAQMVLTDGITTLANKTLKASDGDVRFSFKSNTTNLVVNYFVNKVSSQYGMRLMCWLW